MKNKMKQLFGIILSLVLVLGLMPGMSQTVLAADEILLTTLTFGGSSTYSETTSGVVSVTATNVTAYNSTYGWLWFDEGSLSVTAKEGYTITKCVFRQNGKTPITDTEAPFEIHFSDGCCTEDTNWDMDGVTSIEVYRSKATQTITAEDVTATYGDTDKSVSATVTEPTTGGGEISYAVKSGSEDYIDVASDGKLTIKKVPSDGKAYVTVTAAATDDYAQATKEVTVTINTKAMTVSAEDVNATVDGQAHGITVNVTDPASGATVKYGTEEGSYTLDASPTQTEVGTQTVYYQVTADNYTTYIGNATVTVSDKGTQTIIASDVTATYGETGKKVEATTNGNGAISYAVKDGSADYIDVDASTGALTIKKVGTATVVVTAAETGTYAQTTKEVTVTINKANAVAATVTANNRTYDGTDKPLVNVTGEATGGEMQYALGTNATTAPTDENLYTTSIPTATEAGTYNVYFKVSGNNNYNDYEGSATVTISKKPVEANISADDKTYDGKTDATVSASVKPEDLVSGDSIEITGLTGNFTDANAGEDKKVTVDSSAKQISGTGSDNYEVSIPEETTASITHLITEVKEVPATCTETGKKQHWKDEEGTLYKDAEGKETATEAELVIPALEHDWNNPTYEWAEDNSTVTATRTCKNDASHIETETAKTTSKVTKDATETEEGETTYTATFKNPAFTEQTKTESIPKLEPEEKATYSNTKGNGTQWTKGSTSTADFTFKRSKNDSETFSHFTGIQVDGKDVAASNYTAEAGSVIVKLKPSYLETLSVGEHTLTALFDDGNNASAKFTVVAKKASGNSTTTNSTTTNSTTKKANTVSSTGAPKTGDTSNMLLWITILCASILVLFNVINVRGKRGFGNRR